MKSSSAKCLQSNYEKTSFNDYEIYGAVVSLAPYI